MDSNLSKVSADAKANPQFIKPKRREMPYCKDNHICVYGSDYHFLKSQCATWSRMRVSASSWEHGWRYSTSLMCGDDRFILCADGHLSASFASLYAIGQIVKQLIFVIITPQESFPVRRNGRSRNHALYLRSATVRSTIPCRLFQAVCYNNSNNNNFI